MKKPLIVYPFLFAIVPILFLMSHNIEEVWGSDIVVPIVASVSSTFLLWFLLSFIFKNKEKAGLITSLFLLLFFSYGYLHEAVIDLSIGNLEIGRHRYALLLYGMLFIVGVSLTIRTDIDLNNFSAFLNVMSVSLVVMSLITIGVYNLKTSFALQDDRNLKGIKASTEDLRNSTKLPDIYYIILDAYASSNVLKEVYGYDNHEFEDYLTDKGFYIASESRSNYPWTVKSLASSLNMEYINNISDTTDVRSEYLTILFRNIQDNKVMRFLKSKGYKFINLESSWVATRHNKYADWNTGCNVYNEFYALLTQTTMIKFFEDHFQFAQQKITESAGCFFSKIAEIKDRIEGPRFVFAHILIPHPPFVLNPDGELKKNASLKAVGDAWDDKQGYLDQVLFTNKKIKEVVDKILLETDTVPIVIIQGDHGSASSGRMTSHPSEILINERMRIFNAYYLPDGGADVLYDSITPVNTFRLIFNYYFNAGYDLLDDRSYYSAKYKEYEFIDVTDKIK